MEFQIDGTFIRKFGKKGTDKEDLDGPFHLTVLQASDEIAVANKENGRVTIYDIKSGYVARTFGTDGAADGEFHRPNALVSDFLGNIAVLDYGSKRLQVFSAEGTHLYTREDLSVVPGDNAMAWSSTEGCLTIALERVGKAVQWAAAR
jgi:hypothetical protein